MTETSPRKLPQVRVWVRLSGCLLPLLSSLAFGADYRQIDTQTYSFSINFQYGMNESVLGNLNIPAFNNTDGVLEGVNVNFDATTFMSWTQQLFQRVPVGTRFAEGHGSLVLDFRPTNLEVGRITLDRGVFLDCIPNGTGFCAPFTNQNAYQFGEKFRWTSRLTYLAQEIGGTTALQAANSKVPSSLGDFNGNYRTSGTVSVDYIYDATPESEHARQAYFNALNLYLPTLGSSDRFDQVAFSRVLYAEAIRLRETISSVNGRLLTQNQVIKRVEYTTRGISGALIQASGLQHLGDSGDIANDAANAFIPLAAPIYVALKSIGTGLGVDYSEKGGGKASVARAADVGSAYAGFLKGALGVEAALNSIYGLGLSEQPPVQKAPQPAPEDRQKGVEIPLRLTENGPIVKSNLYALNIDNAAASVLLDPPNNGRTLVAAAGLRFTSLELLDSLGSPLAFHIEIQDLQFDVGAGSRFYFAEHSFADGVDAFFVSGIKPSVSEFDLSVTFSGPGSALVTSIDVTAVPEPSTKLLYATGLMTILALSRRKGVNAFLGKSRQTGMRQPGSGPSSAHARTFDCRLS